MHSFSPFWFFGALAIFLFGIKESRIGLQLYGGERLKILIAQVTDNRLKSVGVGAFVTVILHSSSATANMLVSFAGSGLISLPKAMAILLGADIGTTVVVLLLSLKQLLEYAMLVLIFGVFLQLLAQRKKTQYLSRVLIGFGFIFFGLNLMVQNALPLKDHPWTLPLIQFLSLHPLMSFLFAASVTPLLSSAGTIGLTLAFAFSGVLTFEQSLPYIFGANLGTSFSSLVSSFSGNTEGKRVAVAHLLFKFVGVLLFLPLMNFYASFIRMLGDSLIHSSQPSALIALSHVCFNLSISLLFLPFISLGVKLVERLVPKSQKEEHKFLPLYLNPQNLATPSLAFASVKRELLRVADLVLEMFRECIHCYKELNHELVEEIESKDDRVDLLDREIKLYLTQLSQENLTDEQAKQSLSLFTITGVLEEIGDIIVQNILDMSGKKIHRAFEFSEEGWKELFEYYQKISDTFSWAISALASSDDELIRRVLRNSDHLSNTHHQLRLSHLQRLQMGLKESFETSSIHLDSLSALSRVAALLGDLVKPLQETNKI